MRSYAAIYDNEIRKVSSSGAVFSLLASKFDVIYGAAMTEDNYGCVIIRREEDIKSLRGSKYFQSSVGDTFRQVKRDLLEGKTVLYSGTGCQINGLYMYLGREYENLLLVDIICHGTPSPKLWREYAEYQEHKFGKLRTINFRCKDKGWSNYGLKENENFILTSKDPFMQMFLRNYCLRPSCYECHAKIYKKADISLGDFWGIENVSPEMNDNMGTSLVITRTEKGQKIFDRLKDELKWKEVAFEDAIKKNPSEYSSAIRPSERDTFYQFLNKFGFKQTAKKYVSTPLWERIMRKICGFSKK